MSALKEWEEKYWQMNQFICGIDEAGRGPLAGPLVVCGVILKKDADTSFIDDSKKMSEKQRNLAFELIPQLAQFIMIEVVEVETIDRLNIYRATQAAMEKISEKAQTDLVLTDAMPLRNGITHESLIKGDHKSISIACASIMAKVVRDNIMHDYDLQFPQYGFKKHKGYPTKQHYAAIEQYGILDIHRKSFKLYQIQTLPL